jgi:hypothetical protein
VGWSQARPVLLEMVIVGVLLAIVPTLLMTRKYLKV